MKHILLIALVAFVLIFAELAKAAPSCGSSVTVRLPPARSVGSAMRELSCIAERAKYKCTPVGKSVLKGIGTYYGKGDEFTGGKTVCEKPFKPMKDKILAFQDSLIPYHDFRNLMCGRRAVVVAYEPDTGRCTSTLVELSDTGNLGAKDKDGKTSTRDVLKQDWAKAGRVRGQERIIHGPRIFDLSYAAAKELGYADASGDDDGKAYMEVQVCAELAPNAVIPKSSSRYPARSKK